MGGEWVGVGGGDNFCWIVDGEVEFFEVVIGCDDGDEIVVL